MKYAIMVLAANAVSLTSLGLAAYLIVHDKPHWGWFVFITIMGSQTVKYSSGKNSSDT